MLSLLSPFSHQGVPFFVPSHCSLKISGRPEARSYPMIEIAATPSKEEEMARLYDASQGIEVTIPKDQIDSPLLPSYVHYQPLLAMETVRLPPRTTTLTMPLRGYNLFRITTLAGTIGAVETLCIYILLQGITNQQVSLVLMGMYGGYSAAREARRLGKTYVSAANTYEEGTLIRQVAILFCSLVTLQQCNLKRHLQIEAHEPP